jgi:Tfp pilus assembly protein PilF
MQDVIAAKPLLRLSIPQTAVMIVLLVGATAAVFWPICLHDFVEWDDPKTIAANPEFNPPGISTLGWCWRGPYLDLYIPMTYTVWTGVAQIARLPLPDERGVALDPYPFHAVNLLSHLLSTVLVFAILRLLLPSDLGALAGAFVFALHPIQVEPVAWVSGFKDTLCGLLSLAAIWQYLLYATWRQAGEETGRWQVPYLLATVFLLFAMLAKPSAVTVPIIVGVIDLLLLRRSWNDVSGPLWIWMLLALSFLVIGRMAQPATALDFVAPLYARPFLAGFAMAFHIVHLFVPVGLCTDYGLSPDRLLSWPMAMWTYLAWILPAAIVLLCWIFWRRAPWLLVGCAIFAAALLPVLGLLPFDFQYYSTVADRYLYVAMLGVALMVGYVVSRYATAWLLVPVAAAIVALGFLSYRQTWIWQDTRSLFAHTLKVNPKSFVGHMMLAALHDRANEPQNAIDEYLLALQSKPNDPHAHYDLANILTKQDRMPEALDHFEAAVKKQPNDTDFHLSYGAALAKLSRFDDAVTQFAAARSADPNSEQARVYLGRSELEVARRLADQQNWAAAIPHYSRALEADPNLITAQTGLAEARRRMGSKSPVR